MTAPIAPPRLRISVEGHPLGPMAARAFAGAWISQALDEPAAAEIALADVGADSLGEIRLGGPIELMLDRQPFFAGDVTEIEPRFDATGERHIRIRALDALHRLARTQQPRVLLDQSVGDLVREAADRI